MVSVSYYERFAPCAVTCIDTTELFLAVSDIVIAFGAFKRLSLLRVSKINGWCKNAFDSKTYWRFVDSLIKLLCQAL